MDYKRLLGRCLRENGKGFVTTPLLFNDQPRSYFGLGPAAQRTSLCPSCLLAIPGPATRIMAGPAPRDDSAPGYRKQANTSAAGIRPDIVVGLIISLAFGGTMNEGLALAVIVMLLGLPGEGQGWAKAAATSADFAEDHRACRSGAEQVVTPTTGLPQGVRADELTRFCLQARGWDLHEFGY
jgi:hypothetical protein